MIAILGCVFWDQLINCLLLINLISIPKHPNKLHLTERHCDTKTFGKFVRRIKESTRLKLTLDDDDKGNEHKALPSARMLSKMGCKRAKVSEATQRSLRIEKSSQDRQWKS